MVEMKSIQVENKEVLGIQVLLPHMTLYVIMTNKWILCDQSFDVGFLELFHHEVCIAQVESARSFDQLLSSPLVRVSARASEEGLRLGMSGYAAIASL